VKNFVKTGLFLVLGAALLIPLNQNTEAKGKTIDMKIQESTMEDIFKKEKKFKNAVENKLDIDSSDIEGDVKLNLKFKKTKDDRTRSVEGTATVNMGKEKIKFDLENARLVKSENSEGEEIYLLTGDSTIENSDGQEEVCALTFTWNKTEDKKQGAITIGTVSDYAVIVFGDDQPLLKNSKDEFKHVKEHQKKFDKNEYEEESN